MGLDKNKKSRVLHVNNLKKYEEASVTVHTVVVAEELDGEFDKHKLVLKDSLLSIDQNHELEDMLKSYKHVFSDSPGQTERVQQHRIITDTDKPTVTHPCRFCPAWRDQVKEELEELLTAGVMCESTSAWASPIVPIRKSDGRIRLCVDFRRLNKVTKPGPFFMPLMEDVLDKLGEAKYLFKLYLTKGFYQIPVASEDVEKTAFLTPMGKFEFLSMSFGLMNAPGTFQRAMQEVLVGQENHSSPYIDDIIIISLYWHSHLEHISWCWKL